MKKGKPKNKNPRVHNAGSGGFNQGSKQEDGAKKVIVITDKEKLTGQRELSSRNKKK